jgi:hypothetical protein
MKDILLIQLQNAYFNQIIRRRADNIVILLSATQWHDDNDVIYWSGKQYHGYVWTSVMPAYVIWWYKQVLQLAICLHLYPWLLSNYPSIQVYKKLSHSHGRYILLRKRQNQYPNVLYIYHYPDLIYGLIQ